MSGTTATHLVFFIILLVASSAFALTLVGHTHVVSDAIDGYGSTTVDEIETEIAVISDPESHATIYDPRDEDDQVSVLVSNIGDSSIPLGGNDVGIVIDGEYVSDPHVEILEDPSASVWQPESTARISFDRELDPGAHRLVVSVASNEDVLEFEVPEIGDPAAVSYEAEPDNETVDDGETIAYEVTIEDGFGDPVGEDVEVEADATDGFDVEINGDGDVTTELTDADGKVTLDVSSDTTQDDVDVVFTELVNGNSATGNATWEGEQEDGSLSGIVSTETEDGDDEDLEGETVTIENSPEQTATVDADGSYEFDDVDGGEYTLWIDADGHRYYETTVIVDGSTTHDVPLLGNVENVDAETSYRSLDAAADDVADEETLELAETTYDASEGGSSAVDVTASNVTVRSLGTREETVLDAGGADVGLSVRGEGGTVDGLTLTNVDPSGTGIELASAPGATLENVDVSETGVGIAVDGSDAVQLTKLEATGNDDVGVRVSDSDEIELEDVYLTGNGDGIRISENTIFTLRHSTVSNNVGDGVSVTDSTDLTLSDTVVSDNGGDGLRIFDGTSISVDYTRFADNGVDGIHLRDTNNVDIVYVELLENERNGALVQADEAVIDPSENYFRIWYSNVVDNGEHGMWAEDSEKPDGGNGDLGDGELRVDDEKITGEENWWGDEDGPEAAGANGVSDETIRFEPVSEGEHGQAGPR
ncbi:hypothetical protein EA462_09180 [Natrarchaeobius halalkaliphilus]|uniref:Periplasmic copper-binding protein NosD beta helix domain-containing protein n=1 Tax=Natrarchaeobius halalkaliphilus TaxID=1679091 RepID=A0A3N6M4J2_9EURY|nr:right-handed parallel beta-helix repeat-containing protein [Natrarchaeobius halalkaliphilus]RQG90151.1 hypothetical protein EA462_09180 [Natrarchaeobius halalkaliphilus]